LTLMLGSYLNKSKETWRNGGLRGLSLRAKYSDGATAACRQSLCQLLWIEGATWSAWRIPMAVFSHF
jgi:hypothetical protein